MCRCLGSSAKTMRPPRRRRADPAESSGGPPSLNSSPAKMYAGNSSPPLSLSQPRTSEEAPSVTFAPTTDEYLNSPDVTNRVSNSPPAPLPNVADPIRSPERAGLRRSSKSPPSRITSHGRGAIGGNSPVSHHQRCTDSSCAPTPHRDALFFVPLGERRAIVRERQIVERKRELRAES